MPDLPARRIAAALLLAFLPGCGTGEPPPPLDVYQTRGVVRQLPDARAPGSSLMIRHETIAEFEDEDGEVVGMESMTMPFAVADEALLDGVAVGDKVAVTFAVHWQGGDPLRITALEKLPPGTTLDFEPPAVADEMSEPS